tara:strand:- start:1932 stop:2105 length:174 start_codon:yes stop_codon:yes gene_type:complete
MKKKKKVKETHLAPMKKGQIFQIDMKTNLEKDKKIKPQEIFEGYNKKKKEKKVKSKY